MIEEQAKGFSKNALQIEQYADFLFDRCDTPESISACLLNWLLLSRH